MESSDNCKSNARTTLEDVMMAILGSADGADVDSCVRILLFSFL